MARPARVRIRRRKPWVLCRRRLFGWNVRLLNVFTPLEGAWLTVRHRVVSGEPVASCESTGTAHPRESSKDWTVMDMRHRSTPVATCQRYALRVRQGQFERSADASCDEPPEVAVRPPVQNSETDTAQPRVCRDTPQLVDIERARLWTTVDPRPAVVSVPISGQLPQHDRSATPAISGSIPGRDLRVDRPGHKGPTGQQSIVASQTGTSFDIAQPVDKGVESRDTRVQHDWHSQERERDAAWTQHRTPGSNQASELEVLVAGDRGQPASQPAGVADLQQAVDARGEHRRGRRAQRVHPQPARGPAAHPHRGHPQRAPRQAGAPRGERGPDAGDRRPPTTTRPGTRAAPPDRVPRPAPARSPARPRPARPPRCRHRRTTRAPRSTPRQVGKVICRHGRPAPR